MEGRLALGLVFDVLGAVVLAALIYGMANWRRRPKSPEVDNAREEAGAKIIVTAAKDHKAAPGDIYNAAFSPLARAAKPS